MELSAVTRHHRPEEASVHLQKLQQGVPQTIVVDPRKLLERIMDALGAKPPTIVSETDCGGDGVKLRIQLDLPFPGEKDKLVLEGAPSTVRSTAHKNAIMVALEHLYTNCHVKLIDFSMRVADSVDAPNTHSCLTEAMLSVKTMLLQFEKTLSKIQEMTLELEKKMKTDNDSGKPYCYALIYFGISSFLASVLQKFSAKTSDAISRLTTLERTRIAHTKKFVASSRASSTKLQTNTVVLSAVYLLDYVLSYFGFGPATYTNGPDDDDNVEALAIFDVPRMKQLRLCGRLCIKGNGDSTQSSEEAAAFRSLLLMESNFNVTIVDLYHEHRVETEKIHTVLLGLARDVFELGDSIRELWSQLMQEFSQHRANAGDDTSVTMKGGGPADQNAAYQVTMQALDKLEQDSAKEGYTICWDLYAKLEEIKCKLNLD